MDWNSVGKSAIAGFVGGALGAKGGPWKVSKSAGVIQHVAIGMVNQVTVGLVTAWATGENYEIDDFYSDLGMGTLQGIHYYRNQLNKPELAEQYGKQVPQNQSGLHKEDLTENEIPIKKTYSRHESVKIKDTVTGTLRDASENNMGTYNYAPFNDSSLAKTITSGTGHFVVDIIPYFAWKNTPTAKRGFTGRLFQASQAQRN